MPKPTDDMPSVMMKGETPNTATPMPLQTPTAVPGGDAGERADRDGEHRHVRNARHRSPPSPCADHRGQRQDRADGEIEAAGQQREHLPERDDDQIDRLADDVGEVANGEEIVRHQREDDQRHAPAGTAARRAGGRRASASSWRRAAGVSVSTPLVLIRRPSSRRTCVSRFSSVISRLRKLRLDAAAIEDIGAVREVQDLGQVGGDQHDRRAGLAEIADEGVDRDARADIDADRRLVEDEHVDRPAQASWRAAPSAGCRRRR